MTKQLKILSAIVILSAAVATPVLAQDAGVFGPYHHGRHHHVWNYRGAYNQMGGPSYAVPPTQSGRNIENFGFSGRDPSRIGGEDPSLHPSGS
jgi:hypothetical protein